MNELEKQLKKAIEADHFSEAESILETSERNAVCNEKDQGNRDTIQEVSRELFLKVIGDQNASHDLLIALLRQAKYTECDLTQFVYYAVAKCSNKIEIILLHNQFGSVYLGTGYSGKINIFDLYVKEINSSCPESSVCYCADQIYAFSQATTRSFHSVERTYQQLQTCIVSALEMDKKFVFSYVYTLLEELSSVSQGVTPKSNLARSYDDVTLKLFINMFSFYIENVPLVGAVNEKKLREFYEQLFHFKMVFNPETDISSWLREGSQDLFPGGAREFANFIEPKLLKDRCDTFKTQVERWGGSFWKDASTQTEKIAHSSSQVVVPKARRSSI